MDKDVQKSIIIWREVLCDILNRDTNDETKDWIKNLIKCFDYALDEKNNFPTEGEVFNDLLKTFHLLYKWIVEKKDWAWLELREKYKTVYSSEEVSNALRKISSRLSQSINEEIESVLGLDNTYSTISVEEFIKTLSEQWSSSFNFQVVDNSKEEISKLKKRIKHCKNHMERKKLEQELNALYKERRTQKTNKRF